MNVLIDTNVILDAVMNRTPHADAAQKLFLLAAEDNINASITANSVTDIYYLVNKSYRNVEQSKQVLLKLFTLFKIADATGIDCQKALDLNMSDYEDALVATIAKRIKADYIITRNLKDFENSPIPAVSAEDFVKKL